jgi:hypothetical protein
MWERAATDPDLAAVMEILLVPADGSLAELGIQLDQRRGEILQDRGFALGRDRRGLVLLLLYPRTQCFYQPLRGVAERPIHLVFIAVVIVLAPDGRESVPVENLHTARAQPLGFCLTDGVIRSNIEPEDQLPAGCPCSHAVGSRITMKRHEGS